MIKNGALLPKAPYKRIAETVLGSAYELSVAAVSPLKARELNKKYRNKTYTPDVLAFPYGKLEGEIILNAQAIKREAGKMGMTPSGYAAYIFMHACVHLTGREHGKEMSDKEAHFAKVLGLKTPVKDK